MDPVDLAGTALVRNLKAYRIKAGLTQAEIAARVGAHPISVCCWESGKTRPRAGALERIIAVFREIFPAGLPVLNQAAGAALGMKPRDGWQLPGKALDIKVINELPAQDILRNAVRAIKTVLLEGQVATFGGTCNIGVGVCERQLVAEFLGVDLAKEYAVDKDYLEKKTKAEILAFGKKFKLLKPLDAAKLKKPELIKAILAHGQALVGKVPDEILKTGKS